MNVFIYGDNVNTDAIIPARYLNTSNPSQLAAHCMEDMDADFARTVRTGDVLVAGSNFGCGSSREHAPLALKATGITCVIAASFARIFYRNAINIGLPVIEDPEAALGIRSGDELKVDINAGLIHNLTTKQTYRSQPPPPFVQRIVRAGGLLQLLAQSEDRTESEVRRQESDDRSKVSDDRSKVSVQ